MARLRTTAAALVAAPSSVAAVTAITVHSAMGGPALAFRLAMLAGALTLLALVAALSQETIRSWIAHRAEQRRAAAEAHAIKTLFMAATGGPDRTPEDARQKRRDARAFAEAIGLTSIGQTSLGDAMQITRGRAIEGGTPHAGGPGTSARRIGDPDAGASAGTGRRAGGTGTDGRTGTPAIGDRAGGRTAGDSRSRVAAPTGLDLPMAAAERPVRSVPPVTGEA